MYVGSLTAAVMSCRLGGLAVASSRIRLLMPTSACASARIAAGASLTILALACLVAWRSALSWLGLATWESTLGTAASSSLRSWQKALLAAPPRPAEEGDRPVFPRRPGDAGTGSARGRRAATTTLGMEVAVPDPAASGMAPWYTASHPPRTATATATTTATTQRAQFAPAPRSAFIVSRPSLGGIRAECTTPLFRAVAHAIPPAAVCGLLLRLDQLALGCV